MLPTSICGHWSLYVWDLENHRIHVMDPVLGKKNRDAQHAVHSQVVGTLHEKLFDCIEELFNGFNDSRRNYKIAFYNFAHAGVAA